MPSASVQLASGQGISPVLSPLSALPAAVLFDMDGLLLDSERVIAASLVAVAEEMDAQIEPAFWLSMVGKASPQCQAMLAERIGADNAAELLRRGFARYSEAALAGIPHRPGVLPLLDWLAARNIPCAVGTSTRQPLAGKKLAAAGLLGYFQTVVSSTDVPHPKPAPDTYLEAAKRLGVKPGRCLVLEDSPTGVRAALAAGMTAIQVPDLVLPDEETRRLGHRIASSLIEVQQWLSLF
ncbi:MAG: HAD family phosphatase [Lautropia sp.]|nr:HAD family phosphatase [Lautropia sp.]